MDLIHEALKKAQAEGRQAARSAQRQQHTQRQSRTGPSRLENAGNLFLQRIDVSGQISDDVQNIVENIQTVVLKSKIKAIGFTSAMPQEGTTTLALATATLMADKLPAAGARVNKFHSGVLLIDAQVRNPALHSFYEDEHPYNLSDLLADKFKFEQVLRKVENTNLSVLPCGPTTGEKWLPADSRKLKKLLAELGQFFEFIFIDLPSVLKYSEGVSCGAVCDGVVFVVRAGRTTLAEIEEARARLMQADINILGSILNRQGITIPDSLQKLL